MARQSRRLQAYLPHHIRYSRRDSCGNHSSCPTERRRDLQEHSTQRPGRQAQRASATAVTLGLATAAAIILAGMGKARSKPTWAGGQQEPSTIINAPVGNERGFLGDVLKQQHGPAKASRETRDGTQSVRGIVPDQCITRHSGERRNPVGSGPRRSPR